MFSGWMRVGLVFVSGILGVYQLQQRHHATAAMFLVAIVLLIYGHYRYGTVWLAFRRLRTGDTRRASRLLAQISTPRLLNSQNRAYYEWIKGELACEAGDFAAAESHFRQSLAHDLRTSNNRCVVEARLAAVLIKQNMSEEAQELIRVARQRQHKPQIDTILDDLEKAAGVV